MDANAAPSFDRLGPDLPLTPLVYASPHSGVMRPADMVVAPDLDEASIRSAEDVGVDRLIAPAAEAGVALLLARYSRTYIDLNRAPEDLDPLLIPELGPEDATWGPRARAGYGVAPRLTGDGRVLNAAPLTLATVRARLAQGHAPYHAELDRMMETARESFGRALLIDWHSMPARAARQAVGRPLDVVLGDRHGASCAGAVTRRVRAALEKAGWRVGLNRPYAGGWSTERLGRPAEGFEALQIELNRDLYLDARTLTPGPGFTRARSVVAAVTAALLDELGTKKKPRPRARHESL